MQVLKMINENLEELELLDKLQKRICRTAGQSFTCCLSRAISSSSKCSQLKTFYRYSPELTELVPFPYSRGRSTRNSDRLHDFSMTIRRCCKDVYVNSFFPRTARPWNSLAIQWFPLTYDLSGFKSRINRHSLTLGSF